MSRIDAALDDLRRLDDLARRDTRLARRDPRAALLATLAFTVTVVSFERHAVVALLPLALFPAAMAALGEVPAGVIARRLLLAAPFAVLVGIANPWIDRTPVPVAGLPLAAGWLSFASILLRFALTVGAALVLVAATGVVALGAAAGRLGAPRLFVAQLMFLYRYAFVLAGEASRMLAARRLRGGTRARLAAAEYGPLLGHLLLRAFDRAQRIHRAMRARGFDGHWRTLRPLRWRVGDTAFVAGWCAYFAACRAVDLPLALGRLLTGAAG